jgi:hypothetical protein
MKLTIGLAASLLHAIEDGAMINYARVRSANPWASGYFDIIFFLLALLPLLPSS